MPIEVRHFSVTIPAGTEVGSPVISSLAMPPRDVNTMRVLVPPGARGHVGFSIGAANQPILPFDQGAWIVADGDTIEWALDDQIDSGAWQLFAYNTGSYDHTLYVTFLVSLPRGPQPATNAAPVVIPPSSAVASDTGVTVTAPVVPAGTPDETGSVLPGGGSGSDVTIAPFVPPPPIVTVPN